MQSWSQWLFLLAAIAASFVVAVEEGRLHHRRCDYDNVDEDYLAGPEPFLYDADDLSFVQERGKFNEYMQSFDKKKCHRSTKHLKRFMKESHTEDSRYRECLLRIVRRKDGPKPWAGARKIKVGIIGAGMSGLVAGYELKHLGYDVTILEASQRIGGRAKTFRGETFSDDLHGEAGPMRFPPAHYLTFAYLQEMKLKWNKFITAGDEALYYITSKDGHSVPYPKKIFNSAHPDYKPDVVQKLCRDFNVKRSECEWPPTKFANAMTKFIVELKKCGWEHMMKKLDNYTTRSFLESLGWSKEFITFTSVIINQENFLQIGFIEYFKDYVGQFWTDSASYRYPKHDPDRLYTGLPRKGLHQVKDGTDALPSAFYDHLKENLIFGALVRKIKQHDHGATVEFTVQDWHNRQLDFDYLLVTLPFTVLRDVMVEPPFSVGKRQSIRELHYISATKILMQFRKAFWTRPNKLVPPAYNHKGIKRGGGSTTDLPLRAIYYPTDSYKYNQRAVLLAAYTWEGEADRWGSMDESCRLRRALEYIAKIHGDEVYDLYETGTTQVWKTQPYSGAAVSYFYPQQRELLFRNSYRREKRCFFSGEHTSFTHFWIQGAIQSGLRAVIQIYQASRKEKKTPTVNKEYFPNEQSDYLHFRPALGIQQEAFCLENAMSVKQSMQPNSVEFMQRSSASQFVNVIKGKIHVRINGAEARLDVGASLFVPKHSSYVIAADNSTVELLKFHLQANNECKQLKHKQIQFNMISKDYHASLSYVGHGRLSNISKLNNLRYVFGTMQTQTFYKAFVMNINGKVITQTGSIITNADKVAVSPSMIAFLPQDTETTFTASMHNDDDHLTKNHQVHSLQHVLKEISQYNSYRPFCVKGIASFDDMEVMDVENRPLAKRNVDTIVTGCYADKDHTHFNREMWQSIVGKGQNNLILAASISAKNTHKITGIYKLKLSSIPTKFKIEVVTVDSVFPTKL